MSFLSYARPLRRAPMLLLAALLLSSFSAARAGDELSLASAVQLAVQRSQQLAAQGAAARAGRELAVAAAQLPDPVLKAGIDNLPATGPDRGSIGADFMTMRRIGLSQELVGADKRKLRAERYTQEALQAEAQQARQRADISRDTALAWLERHFAELAETLLARQREQTSQQSLAAQAAYRGGRGSQAEVLAAEVALLQADDRLAAARQRVRAATLMLGRWTGATAATAALAPPPAMERIPLDAAALDEELNQAPEIVALRRREDAAAAEVRLAQAERKSDWTVDVAWQQRGSAYSNMVSFGVSVPLQWDRARRQDRTLAARLAQADQAQAEREEAHRAHVAETRTLIEDWRSGQDRLRRYHDELLPRAAQNAEAVLAAYRGARATLADVLAARRNETDARLAALQLEADTARLWAQLNYILPPEGR
ncbi:outer membrane protein TolC [Duganella sp. 1224]|uniref:TolC family protein n=1 Tax=Duganella sp. 1224 TaxID=2587052 RepID=UPI001829689D|nr:TolC family protein [Duganella sp. 1224]NYE61291.1 outer membrane protein TolC [Duganella sp. 1224]